MTSESSLRYPIGSFKRAESFTPEERTAAIEGIRQLPQNLRSSLAAFSEGQLETPYRPEGWTVKQLVHHVADSHMNAYIRFKLGLTETNPTIKPYEEALWAKLSDTKNLPINISLTLLHALHARWSEVIKNIKGDEWNRTVFYPEMEKEITLWHLLGLYVWHSK